MTAAEQVLCLLILLIGAGLVVGVVVGVTRALTSCPGDRTPGWPLTNRKGHRC